MSTPVVEKWVIGREHRFDPCREMMIAIPHHHHLDETWYFLLSENTVIPQSRVFDTPQEAAIATVKLNDEKIRWLVLQNQRVMEWHETLEAERLKKEQEATKEHD